MFYYAVKQKKIMKQKTLSKLITQWLFWGLLFIAAMAFYRCSSPTSAATVTGAPPSLPVITLTDAPVTTFQDYTASIEGLKDIEIRPQVKGILKQIYVDEGDHVQAGQPLFRIDARTYQEELNQAKANLQSAQATLQAALINVNRLTPLVTNHVVSDIELQTAKATYAQAKAQVASARSTVGSAEINLGFTDITAPADGYIGSIPLKKGSLVGGSSESLLTVLSETNQMHVYFSMSEKDFLRFKANYEGKTIEEKIEQMPAVSLLLSDNSLYPEKGKVELVEGRFDQEMGAINFRAVFPNANGLLRSGNTGRIRLPSQSVNGVIVPQGATFELQDKIFAFQLSDSNKVESVPLQVAMKKGNYYVLKGGLKPGDKIVLTGLGRLSNGMEIAPEKVAMDSLLKANPYN